MRRKVRLTESDLHRMIREAVIKAINEVGDSNRGQYMLGALAARKKMQGMEKGITDDKSGYNDVSKYAANKRNNTNGEKMKQNSFYNGFHSGKDSREYGYNYMKNLDKQNESLVRKVVRESIKRVLREGKLPSYDEPVFIECTSPEDADASVEIGYSDYSSSLFYVGECGTDGYAAVAAVVQWLEENGLIDHYAYSEEDLDAYHPDDIIDVEGYYFPSWQIHVNQLCDNHGGRR